VTYLQFLGQWYNLIWLGAVGAGLLFALRARMSGRGRVAARTPDGGDGAVPTATRDLEGPRTSPAAAFITAGVLGLTLNGAIHDFHLGPVPRRFPIVVVASLVGGWLLARGFSRLRHRFAPPVTGITFNREGLEGREAVVLSGSLDESGIGRARYRDAAGVAHIVRVHESDGEATELRFGRRVRLGRFDEERRAYAAERV
jgi:hypothetical protein